MKKASGSKCERCIGRSKDASLGAIPLGSSDSEYNVRKRPILGNLRDGRFLVSTVRCRSPSRGRPSSKLFARKFRMSVGVNGESVGVHRVHGIIGGPRPPTKADSSVVTERLLDSRFVSRSLHWCDASSFSAVVLVPGWYQNGIIGLWHLPSEQTNNLRKR